MTQKLIETAKYNISNQCSRLIPPYSYCNGTDIRHGHSFEYSKFSSIPISLRFQKEKKRKINFKSIDMGYCVFLIENRKKKKKLRAYRCNVIDAVATCSPQFVNVCCVYRCMAVDLYVAVNSIVFWIRNGVWKCGKGIDNFSSTLMKTEQADNRCFFFVQQD